MIFVGIDPGLGGGIVAIRAKSRDVVLMEATPVFFKKRGSMARVHDVAEMSRIVSRIVSVSEQDMGGKEILACVESAHARPGRSGSAMFSLGRSLGTWEGILTALEISYRLVTPQAWQKEMCGGCTGDPKSRALQAASRLFPKVDTRLGKKKPHDGVVDALLVAAFCHRLWLPREGEI